MRAHEITLECENCGGDIHVSIDDMRPARFIKYCDQVCKREARSVRRADRPKRQVLSSVYEHPGRS